MGPPGPAPPAPPRAPLPPAAPAAPSPRMARWLDRVERLGNALPHPITLFAIFALAVLFASAVTAALDVHVLHPRDGKVIAAVNLLDRAGIRRVFTSAVANFMGFAPLGLVLVSMIGVGVAERGGLIPVLLRTTVMNVPPRWLTATIVFVGILAHVASDVGVVLLPPLAAMLFAAVGRHPLAGLAAAFAGVSGGFSANLIPTTLDVLLAGFRANHVRPEKSTDVRDPCVVPAIYCRPGSTPAAAPAVPTAAPACTATPTSDSWVRVPRAPPTPAPLARNEGTTRERARLRRRRHHPPTRPQ